MLSLSTGYYFYVNHKLHNNTVYSDFTTKYKGQLIAFAFTRPYIAYNGY